MRRASGREACELGLGARLLREVALSRGDAHLLEELVRRGRNSAGLELKTTLSIFFWMHSSMRLALRSLIATEGLLAVRQCPLPLRDPGRSGILPARPVPKP